jgi:ParB/RepB/Spo0J family partition protein
VSNETKSDGNGSHSERRQFSASDHLARAAELAAEGRNPFDGAAGAERAFSSIAAAGKPEPVHTKLPLHLIYVREKQTRHKASEKEGLEDLTKAITEVGFLSNLTVKRVGERFEVCSGHRRFYAAQAAGLAEVPVVILPPGNEMQYLKIQVLENTLRNNYKPIEEAEAYATIMEASDGADQKVVAAEMKCDPFRFSDLLRLARLPSAVKEALMEKKVPESTAFEIASLWDLYRKMMPKEQSAVARTLEIVRRDTRDGWSQKKMRQFVKEERAKLGGARRSSKKKPDGAAAAAGGDALPRDGTVADGRATEGTNAGEGAPGAEHRNGGTEQGTAAGLFEKTEKRLAVNLEYLAAGSATGQEKAELQAALTDVIRTLRNTPTRKVDA